MYFWQILAHTHNFVCVLYDIVLWPSGRPCPGLRIVSHYDDPTQCKHGSLRKGLGPVHSGAVCSGSRADVVSPRNFFVLSLTSTMMVTFSPGWYEVTGLPPTDAVICANELMHAQSSSDWLTPPYSYYKRYIRAHAKNVCTQLP